MESYLEMERNSLMDHFVFIPVNEWKPKKKFQVLFIVATCFRSPFIRHKHIKEPFFKHTKITCSCV